VSPRARSSFPLGVVKHLLGVDGATRCGPRCGAPTLLSPSSLLPSHPLLSPLLFSKFGGGAKGEEALAAARVGGEVRELPFYARDEVAQGQRPVRRPSMVAVL
jgi:hypothetical protein